MKEQELTKIIKAALSLEEGEINPERVAKRVAAYIAMSEKLSETVNPTTKTTNDWLLERLKEEQKKQITPTPYSPPNFVPPVSPKEALEPYCLSGELMPDQEKTITESMKAVGQKLYEALRNFEEGDKERLKTSMQRIELRELGLLKEDNVSKEVEEKEGKKAKKPSYDIRDFWRHDVCYYVARRAANGEAIEEPKLVRSIEELMNPY